MTQIALSSPDSGSPDIKAADQERLKLGLEAWKKTIDVQQHFNDLEMRIRSYAVTVEVAVLAAAGVALKDGGRVSLFSVSAPLAVGLLIAGLLGLIAFYLLDVWWYHTLLLRAVGHGNSIEKDLKSHIPGIGLTTDIALLPEKTKSGRAVLTGFYGMVALFLVVILVCIWADVPPPPK